MSGVNSDANFPKRLNKFGPSVVAVMVVARFSFIISLTTSLAFLNSATISAISILLSEPSLRKNGACKFPSASLDKTAGGILGRKSKACIISIDFWTAELDHEEFVAHLQISDMMASARVGTGTVSLMALRLSLAILEDLKKNMLVTHLLLGS